MPSATPTRSPKPASHRPAPHLLQPFAHWAALSGAHCPPPWVNPIRQTGIARLTQLGLPTPANEDWRFTSLTQFGELPFLPIAPTPAEPATPPILGTLPLASLPANRLVFVDGHCVPALAAIGNLPPGARILGLRSALDTEPDLLEPHLSRLARSEGQCFLALNDAYFTDGAFILVPPGVAVPEPIHLVFLSTATENGRAVHPRNLVLAGDRSSVTVFEHFASIGTAAGITNVVTELTVADGAQVEWLRFQDENPATFHFGALHATLGRDTQFHGHSIALGARLSRQSLSAVLGAPGAETVLNGLYLATQDRLTDHHMVVEHAQPHGASHEYFNGILAGSGRAVFHGRILVRPGAQQTDAKQTNKNILLSDAATINAKPQLEIYADDVKCTHGATVGQLDPASIFYLRARGIPLEMARRMLIHAFAGEIVDRVRCAAIRRELDRLVWERLEGLDSVHTGR